MSARGTRNRFRVNHFIDENTEKDYTKPYSILSDALVFYQSYFRQNITEIEDKEEIHKQLSEIKSTYTIVRRDDDNSIHTTEFAKVDRGEWINLYIIEYTTEEDGKEILNKQQYTFTNESIERSFCNLLRENLTMLIGNPDKYYKMKLEYLCID